MQFMFKALHFIAFLYLKIILYFNLGLKALYFIARMNNKKWKVQFYLYQNSLSTHLAGRLLSNPNTKIYVGIGWIRLIIVL